MRFEVTVTKTMKYVVEAPHQDEAKAMAVMYSSGALTGKSVQNIKLLEKNTRVRRCDYVEPEGSGR